MTTISQKVFNEAIKLPPVDRAELVENILSSFNVSNEPSFENEWKIEIEDRVKAYKEGKIKAYPLSDVLNEINSESQ